MRNGFDLRRFDKFVRSINKAPRKRLEPTFKIWGIRYLADTKRKFIKNSKGGGDWPALKQATVRRRRRGTARAQRRRRVLRAAILWDTGTILHALDVGEPGNLFKMLKDGVRVGFGGPAKHPGSNATIADIARFHNAGEGRLPKRQILYWPDAKMIKFMRTTLAKAIDRIGNKR